MQNELQEEQGGRLERRHGEGSLPHLGNPQLQLGDLSRMKTSSSSIYCTVYDLLRILSFISDIGATVIEYLSHSAHIHNIHQAYLDIIR